MTRPADSEGMGLLSRLLQRGTPVAPSAIAPSFEMALHTGYENLEVVGESHYQDNLWRIVGSRSSERVDVPVYAVLLPEKDNPYDANAISVWVNGLLVGHVPRDLAAAYRPGLIELERREGKRIALNARVIGGGMRHEGPGSLGIFIDHDPTDFGIAHHGISDGDIYEGESGAQLDGHLAWLSSLSADPATAVTALRLNLTTTRDPLDRYYLYLELEKRLYRLRAETPTALADFDAACAAHDSEMGAMRPALLAEFKLVPYLHTYHQMAIRQAKAKEWTLALWWAERGLAVYGREAGKPDWPEDLEKRVRSFRAKLTTGFA
jgi:hypothetical protein